VIGGWLKRREDNFFNGLTQTTRFEANHFLAGRAKAAKEAKEFAFYTFASFAAFARHCFNVTTVIRRNGDAENLAIVAHAARFFP
jgi:hypothetical protein